MDEVLRDHLLQPGHARHRCVKILPVGCILMIRDMQSDWNGNHLCILKFGIWIWMNEWFETNSERWDEEIYDLCITWVMVELSMIFVPGYALREDIHMMKKTFPFVNSLMKDFNFFDLESIHLKVDPCPSLLFFPCLLFISMLMIIDNESFVLLITKGSLNWVVEEFSHWSFLVLSKVDAGRRCCPLMTWFKIKLIKLLLN